MALKSKKSVSKMQLTPDAGQFEMDVHDGIEGLKLDTGKNFDDLKSKEEGQDATDVAQDEADIGFKDLESTGAPNIYVGKRNFIHQLMDVALLMANVSQLKSLLSMDKGDKYYFILLAFICSSIVLQVAFTICMLIIWSIEKKLQDHLTESPKESHPVDESRRILAERLDKFGNILVLLIIVSNVFITGFGVEEHGDPGSQKEPGRVERVLLLLNGTKVKL
ncbi:uncharacterized protein LOC123552326 [Mercenaria mercenaria]|uniref:uncharacterized protein LOC123552326 n=1 Tax=Mercenaria mercenaria TaxID=6596 RepID=UPI00234FB17C|nr:uncharacterized protein LOC123552326 [Mercenaria mercenaria]XP_053397815.1 uncharacterized protein LOC123552326 [Mercenaria mercenaria]